MIRQGKLEYWLHEGYERYGEQFLSSLEEYNLAGTVHGRLLIYLLAHVVPGKSKFLTPTQEFPGGGENIERNRALKLVIKVIARLAVENDQDLAERIVLETSDLSTPHKELAKLAKQVKKSHAKHPQDLHKQLALLNSEIIFLETEFLTGNLKGEAFFFQTYELIQEKKQIMQWRYFIAARNYERTLHLADHSICQISLDELEAGFQEVAEPGELLKLMVGLGRFQEAPDWDLFGVLRKQAEKAKKEGVIHPRELEDIFRVLMNFLLRRVNREGKKAYQNVREIFLNNIEDGIFLMDNKILARDLKSIVSILVREKDIQSVDLILERFENRIFDDPNGYAWKYNSGVLKFAREEFREAGKVFVESMHAPDDTYLKADGKIYALRCWVELLSREGRWEVGYYPGSLDSFKAYFRRQRAFSTATQKYYKVLSACLLEFIASWEEVKDRRIELLTGLKKKAEEIEPEDMRNWLLGCIDRCL